MALYFGNSGKLKITASDGSYTLNIPALSLNLKDKLLSLDNFILKDSNGVYLTVKEDK